MVIDQGKNNSMSNETDQLKRQIMGWEVELDERLEQAEADALQAGVYRRQLKKLVGSQEIDQADHSDAIAKLRTELEQIAHRQATFPAVQAELDRRIAQAKRQIEQLQVDAELAELEQLKQEALPLHRRFAECALSLAQAALAAQANQARREELRRLIFQRYTERRGIYVLPEWGADLDLDFYWRGLGTPVAVEDAQRRLDALA
jgi:DNA repair exonuclease SbcCD ATPase subunit